MRAFLFFVSIIFVSMCARAGDKLVDKDTGVQKYAIEGNRIVPTDAYGHKLRHLPYYTIDGDEIVLTDPYGHKLHGNELERVQSDAKRKAQE